MRAIDTSIVEPSTKTRLKKVNTISKNIRFKRTCLFFKDRRMQCHVEYFSHHLGCNFDTQYPKMTVLTLLPNIKSCVFFRKETHLECFLYNKVNVDPYNLASYSVPTSPLAKHTKKFKERLKIKYLYLFKCDPAINTVLAPW
jgi:hypothetical protein